MYLGERKAWSQSLITQPALREVQLCIVDLMKYGTTVPIPDGASSHQEAANFSRIASEGQSQDSNTGGLLPEPGVLTTVVCHTVT